MSFDSAIAMMRGMQRELNRMPMALRNRVSVAVKDEINLLLQEQFDAGMDPAGRPWTPLARSTLRRGRHPPPLTDTGRMRAHVRAVRVGTNVAIESELPAAYHQRGNARLPRRLPRRPIWPEPTEAMPERYETRIALAANTAIMKVFQVSALSAAE